jgi:predicted nucleic acid-binding protein
MSAVYIDYLDASALVKLFVRESGSAELASYLKGQPNWRATPFCFYEALNVLKRKMLNKEITREQYLTVGRAMSAEFASRTREAARDISFFDPFVFDEVRDLCQKHVDLDFSDAFQLVTVKRGIYSPLIGGSQTVLVTADGGLATAAEAEGLKVKLVRAEK